MKILLYIPYLSQGMGGTRQYSKGILEIMAKDVENKYFVYHNTNDAEIIKILQQQPQINLIKDENVKYSEPSQMRTIFIRCCNFFLKKIGVKKQIMPPPSIIDVICEQYSIDIIHSPYQFIPKTDKAKLITTLHDVQELHFPEFFTPQQRADRSVLYMDYLFRADKTIVSYKHVKDDLIRYFGIAEDKIDILLIQMNDLWINHFSDEKIVDLKEITGGDEFLLYPANTWKHKNHLRLIEAVALLRDKYNTKIKIICTGNKTEYFNEINELIQKNNLESQIIFPGIVSEEVLYSLYKTCKATVVPTLYEAGSFPLYESILLEVPVICSNVTSLPETICNSDCIFDPYCIEDIALKMKSIWEDDDFRNIIKERMSVAKEKINSNNPLPVLQKIYHSI